MSCLLIAGLCSVFAFLHVLTQKVQQKRLLTSWNSVSLLISMLSELKNHWSPKRVGEKLLCRGCHSSFSLRRKIFLKHLLVMFWT